MLLRAGLRIDQVRNAFSFYQVKLSILKRTPGELAGFRKPGILETANSVERMFNNRSATMQIEFRGIFSGVRRRPGHEDRQSFIDHFTGSVPNTAIDCLSRRSPSRHK